MTYVPGTWGEVVSEASAKRDEQRAGRPASGNGWRDEGDYQVRGDSAGPTVRAHDIDGKGNTHARESRWSRWGGGRSRAGRERSERQR